MASRANVTNNEPAVAFFIQGKFCLTSGNDIKITVIFGLSVDILSLFDYPPMTGVDNLFNLFGGNVSEEDRFSQALFFSLLIEHNHMVSRYPEVCNIGLYAKIFYHTESLFEIEAQYRHWTMPENFF